MKTVGEASQIFKQKLSGIYDANESEAITMLVLSEVIGFSKAKLKAFPETEFTPHQQQKLRSWLTELQTGKPLQYVLGYTEFYGLTFKVNQSVLIPRPETEELVSWILETAENKPLTILDIGTGSGCIAIALKHQLPQASVYAIDVSEEALQTAGHNARINHTEVTFIRADVLNPNLPQLPQFDVIVSNPPYVTLADKEQMHTNVTDFEPHTALFVPENDPLLFYRAIADLALTRLKAGGLLFFEINENLSEETIQLLNDKRFKNIELRKDIRGKDRIIKAS